MENVENVEVPESFNTLGIVPLTITKAKKAVNAALDAGLVPVLVGDAGIGKSAMIRQLAQERGWDTLFFFLAHLEREDLSGIPFPNEDGSYSFLAQKSIRDILCSEQETLLVLDEWNRGERATMNAAFTMMEDRSFGGHQLGDNIRIIAAMNPSDGDYLVNEAEKDPAFRRRLCFVGVRTDIFDWLKWAEESGVDSKVIAFVKSSPQSLLDTRSREAGKVYANPSGWEKVSRVIGAIDSGGKLEDDLELLQNVITGVIGASMAALFVEWLADTSVLVDPVELLHDYDLVASKVARLVEHGRVDVISEINEALIIAIITSTPKIDEYVNNLVTYLAKIPVNLRKALLIELSSKLGGDHGEYRVRLSTTLSKNKMFQQAMQELPEADKD